MNHKVKFLATGDIFELIGFVNDKIIIRFNNGQSVGTVPKTGYIPLDKDGQNHIGGWNELQKKYN